MEEEKRSSNARRVSAAESFSAVQMPSDDAAITSPNPAAPMSRPSTSLRPPLLQSRSSSAERLATWVSRRLSGRPSDASDLGVGYRSSRDGKPRGRSPSTTSMLQKDGTESIGTESIYSMYTTEDVQRLTGVVNSPVRTPRRSDLFQVSSSAPPVPKLNLKEYGGKL